jgi:hypothetical protein
MVTEHYRISVSRLLRNGCRITASKLLIVTEHCRITDSRLLINSDRTLQN